MPRTTPRRTVLDDGPQFVLAYEVSNENDCGRPGPFCNRTVRTAR